MCLAWWSVRVEVFGEEGRRRAALWVWAYLHEPLDDGSLLDQRLDDTWQHALAQRGVGQRRQLARGSRLVLLLGRRGPLLVVLCIRTETQVGRW